jgi:hypothetical protein
VWDAPNIIVDLKPIAIIGFLVIWSVLMGSHLYFLWRVAPQALRRWAETEGYQIVERKRAGMFDWVSFAKGRHSFAKDSAHRIYRVVVRDEAGLTRSGLARVGKPHWYSTSASQCPVEIRWGPETGTLYKLRTITDLRRYGWKRSLLGDAIKARRWVLGFALADLVLASLVLLFEGVMLMGVVIGIDRLTGRLPSPDSYPETLWATATFLVMFVLYLPALVTLTVGAIGLIRRKPWGYYYHLAGVMLIAVSIVGIAYTIPALLIAIQPEFRDCCLGKQAAQAEPESWHSAAGGS